MITYNKILCPIDFSEGTDQLIDLAVKISNVDTTIYAFYAMIVPYSIDPNGLAMNVVIEEEIEKHTKENLENFKEKYQSKYPNTKFDFSFSISSDASDSIHNKSKEVQSDLIVMGTHGREGINRWINGSVAESVMRHAECPVFLIKIKE